MIHALRRRNLPRMTFSRSGPNTCDEQVGRFCYWYDEREDPAPDEPTTIVQARAKLVATLDSAYRLFPDDRWTSGQLVRYLTESGKLNDAVEAANALALIDGVELDWQLTEHEGARIWEKNENGTRIRLEVDATGNATCSKKSASGNERRVKAMCRPVTDGDIRTFLGKT